MFEKPILLEYVLETCSKLKNSGRMALSIMKRRIFISFVIAKNNLNTYLIISYLNTKPFLSKRCSLGQKAKEGRIFFPSYISARTQKVESRSCGRRQGKGKGKQAGRAEIWGPQILDYQTVMTDTQPSFVQDIAGQVADGRWEALINGTLFRSIRGVQSKIELVGTPNALLSLSRCVQG
jgi:hypothetical protein